MNSKCFKNVFSKRLGCLVAVGEHASSQGKANGASASAGYSVLSYAAKLTAACVWVSLAWADPAGSGALAVLPTGGQVAQGAVNISQSGAVMNITQSTHKAVVNWNTFDIGTGAKVNIVQPGASAIMLNRVTSANPSQILGQLNANGQVVLVNPNGVLFGKDGSVNANSFTASTLGISDANFMAGNHQFERNGSNASVVNQGSIKTTGGYVALLGASVSNEGQIQTQGGTAYLAAAETIKIPVSGSGRIKLELSPSRINAAVANAKGGTIVTEGGQVYMQSAALSSAVASILQSGEINTSGDQGGAVHLLADGGQIKVDGSITANSTGTGNNGQVLKGGDIVIGRDEETGVLAKASDVTGAKLETQGGFIETSGEYLASSGVKVKAAEWLLDPNNIEINATNVAVTAGNTVVLAADIADALTAGTTVTIATGTGAGSTSSATGVNQATAGTGNSSAGTIAVNSSINSTYAGATYPTLTLSAASNIAASAAITTTGSNIVLQSTGGAISNTAAISGRNVSIDNTGGTINAATGAITKGSSTGTTGAAGISVGESITASGNLNMYGLTTNNIGINLGAAKTLSGGNLNAIGQTGSTYGVSMGAGASVVTTGASGDSVLRGLGASTASGGMAALQMGNATLRAATGTTLTLNGQATTVAADVNTNTRGIRIEGTVDTYGDVTLTGTSGSNDGFLIQSGQMNIREGALKINGTIAANGGGFRSGVVISRPIYLYNGTSLAIVGKAANQSAAMSAGQPEFGVGIGAVIAPAAGQTTAGNISITGYTSSAENSGGVSITSDVSTGTGNITVIGQALGSSTGNSVTLGSNITSTSGDVTVQSIGGKIGLGSGKSVSARNITIDNTGAGLSSFIADTTAGLSLAVGTSMGGSINPSTGAITIGSGLDFSNTGVTLSGSSTATGNINIAGVSATTTSALGGVRVAGNLTANNGAVNIYAKDTAGGANYAYYQSAGTISAGTGGVSINALGSGSNSTLDLIGTTGITSTGTVSLTGNAGTGSGNGIYTSGTVTISGGSVILNGTGGSTGGSGLYLDSTTTISGSGTTGTAVSLTGTSKQAGTAGIFSKAAITGSSDITLTGEYSAGTNVSTAEVNLNSGSITGTSGKAINLSGGVAGSASIVTNGASVNFSTNYSNSNPNTYSGVISNGTGTGAVSNTGGAQVLTGTNTYSGTTTISAGTLQLGNSTTTGSIGAGDVILASAGTLAFKRTDNFTFSNHIQGQATGVGTVNQLGTNVITLAGTNTYGTTNINSGVLVSSGNASAFGTGLVTVSSGAQAYINDAVVANNFNITGGGTTFGGNDLGAIRLQQNAGTSTGVSGTITLNGAATIGGQRYLAGGNVSGGVFTLGAISGTGPLTYRSIFDAQTFSVGTAGSYSGNTVVQNSSTLKFTGAGTPGASTGSISLVSANDKLEFAGNSITLGNAITGLGSVVQSGANTTILTGTNTYSGTTTISAGTLQVGNGGTTGTLGSGAVSVALGSNLNFYRSNALTTNNAISSAGTMNFLGTGVQGQSDYTLGGNNSTFSGSINVSSSRLQISNPNQVGTAGLTVNSGAALLYSNAGGLALNNSLSLAGNGWNEPDWGYLGALRLQNGANFGGAVTLTADARIGAHNDNGRVSGVISGAHNLEFNTPADGTSSIVYLTNTSTYTGTTTVNSGTLSVGNGGATGTLGATTGVALAGGASVTFNKNVNTTIDKSISGNGNVTATITGDLALTSDIALTGTNTINLTASGSITQTSGSLAATNLYMTATNGGIGAVGNRIQSNVTNLSFSGGADVYVTEANAVTVSGRTTANNGNIDVATTNGTMTIGSVNSINGITANGTGNITLSGNATTGNGISINNVVTATNGNVSITGTTASTAFPNAGVYSQSTVAARNITMVAESTSTTGTVLGYYGAGGVFNASQALSLTGTSRSSGNGLYTYTGSYLSGTGMTLVGASTSGQAIGFDAGVTVTNSTSGGIVMTGTATNASEQAFGLRGMTVTNGGGNVSMVANSGKIFSDAGNPAWGAPKTNTITNNGTGSVQVTAGNSSATNSGSIDGSVFTITQNANADVVVSTSGTGNVTSPKIINAGTADIVVAAGSAIAAGTATGGQVLTVAGNTLTQTNVAPGKTYVYSGAPSTTGVLSNLSTGFNNLYYQGTSAALNAGFNQGFDANHANDMTVPGGGSASGTQVFFRTATKPSFSMTLSNNNKSYGAADPAGFASTSGATLTNAVAGVGGNNTFAVTTADALAGLTGGRAAGENVGSYAYSLSASSFNTTLTAQPNLVIGRRDITLSTLVASPKVYDGSTLATITSGTFGNLSNGETLLISGQGLFGTKDVANGKTVTVADVSTLTKANGTGNWSNYNLTTTSKTTTANITKATLTATARDDARFVTQADPANFAGVRFSGFKLGDTEAVVDTSGVTVTRTNAVNDTAAATYPGVLVPGGAAAVNYDFTYVNGNYTIVPARQLLVRTTSQSVVYGTSPTYATTAAYLDGNGVTINTLTRTGTNNNYTFNDGAGTSVTMALKPYIGGAVATQSTSGNTTVGNYDVKDLAYTQTGTNFLGTPVFVGTLSVTPKEITPNATGVSKVYDATTSMANVVVGMTGKITNDLVNIGGTGAFSQSTVGTNLGYSVTGVSLSSTDASNYYLTNGVNSFSGTDGAITRAPLVATANSRTTTFNGGAQSVTGFTVAGLLGTDSVAGLAGISASGATGTNVGTYANTMTVVNQTNYSVTGVNGALTIDPAPIGVTDISGSLRGTVTKVYDGTTVATLTPANYTLTGWLGTDGATVTKTLGTYNNANAGMGKIVTVNLRSSDYQASGGTDLSNYSLPTAVSGAVGVITPKDVSLTGFSVANKAYDGTNLAAITASSILTGVGTETLSLRGNASFSDKNVGVSKLVRINDASVLVKVDGTGQWGNYNLLSSTVTTTANITPKVLQANGLVADKVYDGTTQATLAGTAGVGVVTGDTVFLKAGSALFADKHVSRNASGNVVPKTVTVSGLTLAGADAGNYALSADSFQTQATISPRLLDLQVSVNDKSYDGTTTATARAAAPNLIAGDLVQWDMGVGFFANRDVSRNALGQPLAQEVRFDNLQMTGSDSGNYSLPFSSVRSSAFITPKVLTVNGTSVADKSVDGTTDARVTLGAVQGLVGVEQLNVSVSGRFQTATPGGNKPVDVKYFWSDGANGGKASNYSVPDGVLMGRISTPQNDAIKPILPALKPTSGGGSVTIVAAQPAVASNFPASLPSPQAELVCTVTDLEPCDCEKTALEGLDVCLVPRNTQASRGKVRTSENEPTPMK